MQQQALMKFDPATGETKPYPSHAEQWRKYHGAEAWLFNPWTGTRRLAGDVGTDVFGLLMLPPGEPLYASSAPLEGLPRARSLSDELMDCADRLGSEFASVDPRVWNHLLCRSLQTPHRPSCTADLVQPHEGNPARRTGRVLQGFAGLADKSAK